jgi:hypothetical protein
MPAKLSLAAYAAKNPSRRPGMTCWACSITERQEIDEARRNGTPIPVIREWLINERGYSEEVASRPRLDRHFSSNRHHERSNG